MKFKTHTWRWGLSLGMSPSSWHTRQYLCGVFAECLQDVYTLCTTWQKLLRSVSTDKQLAPHCAYSTGVGAQVYTLQARWPLYYKGQSYVRRLPPAPFAKVFSMKLEIYQKRESFVPRKFPAIRYLEIPLPMPLNVFHSSMAKHDA